MQAGPAPEKLPIDYEVSLDDQLSKSKHYEQSLKRQAHAQSKRIKFLDENPTYQTELLQTAMQIE